MQNEKAVNNTTSEDVKKTTNDIEFFGNPDTFLLICKASSKSQGWMKSTKAMSCGRDVVVQTTSQIKNKDGSVSLSESLTTVNDSAILEILKDGEVIGRQIVSIGIAGTLAQQQPQKYRHVKGSDIWSA